MHINTVIQHIYLATTNHGKFSEAIAIEFPQ